MPTVAENKCCKEMNAVTATMHELPGQIINCITDHPGFESICLNIWVLKTAYSSYRQQYGHMQHAHSQLE